MNRHLDNNRKTVESIRFREALKNVAGRRLTYKELTGKNTRSLFYRPSQGRGRRGKLRLVEDRAKSEKPKELSPYERFREFARRIITVPKSEIAEKEAEYQRGRESEKAMRKAQRE